MDQQGGRHQLVSSVFMLFRTDIFGREGMLKEDFCISAYKSVDPVMADCRQKRHWRASRRVNQAGT